MLPTSYELPFALVLVVGGAVACFAGYRLFRIVLAIFGFILGAMMASSLMGVSNTTGMIVAALIGGVGGALVLFFAYFIGVALLGAAIGALVIAPRAWSLVASGEPSAVVVIALSVVGAIAAMMVRRYVIVTTTAFGGAWTMLVGGLAAVGHRTAQHAVAAGNVWILYPFTLAPGQRWVPIAWIALGLIGLGVQLGITGRKRR